MRYGNPRSEAPTHLGSHHLPLPPEWLPAEELEYDDDDDGPTRAAHARAAGWTPVPSNEVSISGPTRRPAERAGVRRGHRSAPSTEECRSFVASGEVNTSARIEEERLERLEIERREADERRAVQAAEALIGAEVKREVRRSARSSSDDDARRSARSSKSDDRRSRKSLHDDVAPDVRRSSREASSHDRSASASASASRPSASQPSASQPSTSQPSASQPSASQPSASQPSATQPSASARSTSQPSVSARGSDPNLDAEKLAAAQVRQAAALAAMGAIDPLAVPVPPELGGPIYGWIRRLALQADLLGADKVLREAFTDLTSSLAVAIIYPGADGLWTLGQDEEIPKEATPLVAVAQARRAMISSHTALIPVVTSTETVAVVLLTRNPRNPGFHPIEQVAAIALARESAAILHHLAVAHLQKASEIKADQGGLYRGEALEAHRTRGNEGVPVNLSPSWVKRAYPLLVVTILVALLGSIFVTVPTYSSGMGVVILPGVAVPAPSGGTVEAVLVEPGQPVEKGTVLVRLNAGEQDAELRQATRDADAATIMYLYDQQDEMTRKTLTQAINKVVREQERVEGRLVRATKAGTVSDVRVRVGSSLQPGDQVLQIVDPNAQPEVWAFLPGKDRPRLRLTQELQVEIVGYTKSRDKAKISYVSTETLGPTEAAKIVGAQLADSIKLANGSYVWVRAKLPSKSFKTQHNSWFYHHGMPTKTEVMIQSKPFLVTLLPALEKYIPD